MKPLSAGAAQRSRTLFFTAAAIFFASGCGGGGGGGDSSTHASSSTQGSSNKAPSITATPATHAGIGSVYSLKPNASDPDGDALAFSIENRPEWAQFNTVTGELTGTPGTVHTGSYSNIKISVSDGRAAAVLQPFSITVGAAAGVADARGALLQWDLPTSMADGRQLSTLAGVRIHYGRSAAALAETIEIRNPGIATYVVDNLPAGTYYFAVRAFTEGGDQSTLSNVVTKVIG